MFVAVKTKPSPRQGRGDRPRRWVRMQFYENNVFLSTPINQNLNGKLMFIELFSYVHFLPVSARNEPKKRHLRGRGSRIRFDILSPLRIPHTIGTGILSGLRISFLVCRKKAIYLMDKRKSLYVQYCLGSTIL